MAPRLQLGRIVGGQTLRVELVRLRDVLEVELYSLVLMSIEHFEVKPLKVASGVSIGAQVQVVLVQFDLDCQVEIAALELRVEDEGVFGEAHFPSLLEIVHHYPVSRDVHKQPLAPLLPDLLVY